MVDTSDKLALPNEHWPLQAGHRFGEHTCIHSVGLTQERMAIMLISRDATRSRRAGPAQVESLLAGTRAVSGRGVLAKLPKKIASAICSAACGEPTRVAEQSDACSYRSALGNGPVRANVWTWSGCCEFFPNTPAYRLS
jgi:hypothetical protein